MSEKQNNNKKINSVTNFVNGMMNKIYANTYMTNTKLANDISTLQSNMNNVLDDVASNSVLNTSEPNISRVYTRMNDKLGGINSKKNIKDIEDIFNDEALVDNVLASYMGNKYLKDLDAEIDAVCKYMPKLDDALDTRKDNVLSADHFSKDFLSVVNKSIDINDTTLQENIEQLKDRYDLNNIIEEAYEKTAKYGEQFIYIAPYKKALNRLLKNKGNINNTKVVVKLEQEIMNNIINENKSIKDQMPIEGFNINLEFNHTGIIETVVEHINSGIKKLNIVQEQYSINEASFDKLISDELVTRGLTGYYDSTAADGTINANATEIKTDIPGSIIKLIEDRSSVIPIYIEDLCMGYYYIEFKENNDFIRNNTNNNLMYPVMGLNYNKFFGGLNNDTKNVVIDSLATKMSKMIDAKFIANNQDLKKELYMILKYNDILSNGKTVRVTFIPPENMIHMHFKKNRITNRGVSDLAKALFPAKLYSCLYITNVLAILTRGQDKRVYYVKNEIDTNVSQVLNNVINNIKKSNFGIRQIENINNILNVVGRFNDHVIPLGPGGDAPVNIEVLSGQNIDVKTDLMEKLEEIAINTTDVPIELINSRNSMDYAIQATMTSSKFLRKTFNRQGKLERILSSLITTVYNNEFDTKFLLDVKLPPPMFLNITNTNQLINNTKEYVDSMLDYEAPAIPDMDDGLRNIYRSDLIKHYLGSHVDTSIHQSILEKARMKYIASTEPGSDGE